MAIAPLHSVTLDCPDPAALADFYRRLTGGEIVYRSAEFLACEPLGLGFQRAGSASPPNWPDHAGPLRVHLDFGVEDSVQLDELEAEAVALGPDSRRRNLAVGRGGSCSTRPAIRSASPRSPADHRPGGTC